MTTEGADPRTGPLLSLAVGVIFQLPSGGASGQKRGHRPENRQRAPSQGTALTCSGTPLASPAVSPLVSLPIRSWRLRRLVGCMLVSGGISFSEMFPKRGGRSTCWGLLLTELRFPELLDSGCHDGNKRSASDHVRRLKRGMPLTTCSEVESPVRRLTRQETRVRGLTRHSRRDPRNAKRIGRTVRDLFCTCAPGGRQKSGAATAGVHALKAGRLLTFFVIPPAARQTQKRDTRRDG